MASRQAAHPRIQSCPDIYNMDRAMHASVLQVNVSRGGVIKMPIPRGTVNSLGLEGDGHAHPRIHGGPRQALLFITSEGIDELMATGFPVYYGALGENITTRGLDRRTMRIGQRYRVGHIVVELTKVRIPCNALDIYGRGIQEAMYDRDVRAGDALSPLWGLSGFYASVMRAGTIDIGDPIQLLDEAA